MSTRRTALALALVVAALPGCHRAKPTTEVTTTTRRIVGVAEVTAGELPPPVTREDSMRYAAQQRADSAGALVDSMVVEPTRIDLRVGDSIQFFGALRIEGRDASGARVQYAVPTLKIENQAVATIRGIGFIVALAPGETTLLVAPTRPSMNGFSLERPLTRVPVTVTAR